MNGIELSKTDGTVATSGDDGADPLEVLRALQFNAFMAPLPLGLIIFNFPGLRDGILASNSIFGWVYTAFILGLLAVRGYVLYRTVAEEGWLKGSLSAFFMVVLLIILFTWRDATASVAQSFLDKV